MFSIKIPVKGDRRTIVTCECDACGAVMAQSFKKKTMEEIIDLFFFKYGWVLEIQSKKAICHKCTDPDTKFIVDYSQENERFFCEKIDNSKPGGLRETVWTLDDSQWKSVIKNLEGASMYGRLELKEDAVTILVDRILSNTKTTEDEIIDLVPTFTVDYSLDDKTFSCTRCCDGEEKVIWSCIDSEWQKAMHETEGVAIHGDLKLTATAIARFTYHSLRNWRAKKE